MTMSELSIIDGHKLTQDTPVVLVLETLCVSFHGTAFRLKTESRIEF